MSLNNYYMSLPYDLAGSRTKNRFRVELLWGISKFLDIYQDSEFTMIFDYVCDIEVHFPNKSYEFYQIKTHKRESPYSIKDIIRQKNKKSILGKLYVLHRLDTSSNIKSALVSNIYVKDSEKIISEENEWNFLSLSQASQDEVQTALKEELELESIDLSKLHYVFTHMNLQDPQNEIIGKIVTTFTKIKNCEVKKPKALYRLIYDTVSEKACYELTCPQYEDVLINKGVSKAEFGVLLDSHADIADNSVDLTKSYIETIPIFIDKCKAKSALAKIISTLYESVELSQIENQISSYVVSNISGLPSGLEDCISHLLGFFSSLFPIEYSKSEQYVLMILILKRYEEGFYNE